MFYTRSIAGGVVGLIIFAAVIGFRFQQKGKAERELKYELREFISQCDLYRQEQTYLITICDEAHEAAFDHNYQMAYGRRGTSTLDKLGYFIEATNLMIDHAKLDRRDDVAKSLAKLVKEKSKDLRT
jgi:hypothetical protein